MYYSTGSKMADCGLIEAYWNVNKNLEKAHDRISRGFNRSILKCKFAWYSGLQGLRIKV